MAIHLLTGDDESLLRTAVQELVTQLVGDGDRSMIVDEFEGDDYEMRFVVDAAQTPPFLTDKRVVVARDVSRFNADDLPALLHYFDEPLDTSDVVLVEGGEGRMSKKLVDAVKAVGTVTTTGAPKKAGDRAGWVREQISAADLSIDGRATQRLIDWLGEDPGKLDGVLQTLCGAFGPGATLRESDIEPHLGEAGGVPPWDLTDAIDSGDATKALTLLGRMMHGGGRHPLQIMATLHGHYSALAKLDGVDARSEKDAMAATGIRSPYPAKKALAQYRRLGGAPVKRAITLLSEADLDLRGKRDVDAELTMEILVARLSKLR
ncbi:MAG: DNA polymerase III subunit delta [Actinomycetota bacterium]